ncbi:MAG: AMP-binding protein [Pseudomonadota bacterium]
MDLFAPVERNAAFTPQKPAVISDSGVLTYAAFAARVRKAAASLSGLGVAEGDRVAVLAENHADTLVTLYACARLGAVLLPLNWRLAHAELAYTLSHAEPRVLLASAEFQSAAKALRDDPSTGAPALRILGPQGDLIADEAADPPDAGGPERDVLLVYTSGTTGRPKGALLSQRALFSNAIQSHHMHQMTAADRVLTVLPLFHVGGLNIQTTPALQAGATVVLLPRFDPGAMLAALAEHQVTLTLVVPAVMQALLAHQAFASADFSSLRAVATGSTIVPESLIAPFEARVPVLSVYGATETCPIAAYDRLGEPRVEGGTGRAGVLSHIKILDERGKEVAADVHGEIAARGTFLSGYLNDRAATEATIRIGYVLTVDVGSLSEDGTLTVHGRKKHLIISGGENIYPAEIERVLLEHPSVRECAVVGKPDPKWQEAPVAFVVPSGVLTAEALHGFLADRLARFKVPRDVRIVDALPKTALGKVALDVLRRDAETLVSSPSSA